MKNKLLLFSEFSFHYIFWPIWPSSYQPQYSYTKHCARYDIQRTVHRDIFL